MQAEAGGSDCTEPLASLFLMSAGEIQIKCKLGTDFQVPLPSGVTWVSKRDRTLLHARSAGIRTDAAKCGCGERKAGLPRKPRETRETARGGAAYRTVFAGGKLEDFAARR